MSARSRSAPWFRRPDEHRFEMARIAAAGNRGNLTDIVGVGNRIEAEVTNADPVFVTLTLARLAAVEKWHAERAQVFA